MGRRSRKRAARGVQRDAALPDGAGPRARGDGARANAAARPRRSARPRLEERPPASWGSFPLGELVVLLGIVLMVWGLLTWESGGNLKVAAGIVIASLAGLELSLREHLAGFRSHTTLLAGVAALALVSALALGPGPHALGVLGVIGALAFAACFYALRELFKRRSGGLGFR